MISKEIVKGESGYIITAPLHLTITIVIKGTMYLTWQHFTAQLQIYIYCILKFVRYDYIIVAFIS